MLIIVGSCALSAQVSVALTHCKDVVICERVQELEQPNLTLHLMRNDMSIDIALVPTYGLTGTQALPPRGNDPPAFLTELTTFVLPHGFGLWLVATNLEVNKTKN
jgi:hypothetical protein